MTQNKFKNEDIENIEDLLPSIEKMYKFKFEKSDLLEVKTFDEFCELIVSKIDFKNIESCTTQQAFYKLRKSFNEEKIIENKDLLLATKLENLFPKANRIQRVKRVEENIGFKLNILSAPSYILIFLSIAFIVSFISLFFFWKIGVTGLLLSIFGFRLCKTFGKELEIETVKDLVVKITSENYLEVRRVKDSVNKAELKHFIVLWFSENLGIEKEELQISRFV